MKVPHKAKTILIHKIEILEYSFPQNRGIIALGPVPRPYIQIQITKPLFSFHYLVSVIVQDHVLVQELVLGTVQAFGMCMVQFNIQVWYSLILESNDNDTINNSML